MIQEFLARSDQLLWPVAGLLLFLTLFCGVLALVWFGMRDPEKLAELASLPLADDAGQPPVARKEKPHE
jgi:hypothetical protein